MYVRQKRLDTQEMLDLRAKGGRLLKSLREARGLSQPAFAAKVFPNLPKTFVSEIERGRGRIPPERFEAWATALDVTPLWLAQTLMPYYDPITYDVLFCDVPSSDKNWASATADKAEPDPTRF